MSYSDLPFPTHINVQSGITYCRTLSKIAQHRCRLAGFQLSLILAHINLRPLNSRKHISYFAIYLVISLSRNLTIHSLDRLYVLPTWSHIFLHVDEKSPQDPRLVIKNSNFCFLPSWLGCHVNL